MEETCERYGAVNFTSSVATAKGFGMHIASTNVPPNLIQRWMGHSSATTTAIYLDAVGLEEREFAQRMW